ncbi:MAG: F0F1 ATP synthase subunit A [Bacteroidales bacterium]|jgi:F-type H+-transporting ATPase subunit a|nr:F0F1 ATP synthase subunit A [Bacteroidales bacterium]
MMSGKRFWNILVLIIGITLFIVIPFTFFDMSGGHHEGEDGHAEKELNVSEMLIDHIGDAYEWHLFSYHGKHASVHLPVILYSSQSGFHMFMSSKLAHGHHHKGFYIAEEGKYKGKIVEDINHNNNSAHSADSEETVYRPFDFSITKTVFTVFLSAFILMFIFISLGNSYKRNGNTAPRGLRGFFEPLVIFVRDEIAIPNIGKKYMRFMPYLLTVFFFIWFNNLIGLIPLFPFGGNATGNIAVTFTLAIFTLVITNVSASKNYWRHIFFMPGVPKPMWILLAPVELIGIFTKPFALMIRLFANITAGHILILSLFFMIFIFKTFYVAPVSIIMGLFMSLLELLVAAIQAYVFTLLSALFIGMAVEEEHH